MKDVLRIALALSLLCLAGVAHADAIPPGTFECQGHTNGEACTAGAAGTCQSNGCAHNMCLSCIPFTDAGTKSDSGAPPPSGDSGCSLVGKSTISYAGPWVLAGTLAFIVSFARRRRPR
jgi:hypothetical protein